MELRKLIENFTRRNIDVQRFENITEAKQRILYMIPPNATVGIGNSQTLKQMEVSDALRKRGSPVYDKSIATNHSEAKELSKRAIL